ncbi:hypothetical protein GCM10010924_26140 [Rhizobium wenxiniae]|nr:hypothetical protein GCM10010924_26140 [Rhizobium wenxiniae]
MTGRVCERAPPSVGGSGLAWGVGAFRSFHIVPADTIGMPLIYEFLAPPSGLPAISPTRGEITSGTDPLYF